MLPLIVAQVPSPSPAAAIATPFTVDPSAPATVPFVLREGHVIVTATVNGKPLRLVLDSGANGVVLTPRGAARAGLPVDVRVEEAPVALGPARGDDVRIAVFHGNGSPDDVDGLLGSPLFASAVLRIDFRDRTLTVLPPDAQPGAVPWGDPIPLTERRGYVGVATEIDGRPAELLVDTGAPRTMVTRRYARAAQCSTLGPIVDFQTLYGIVSTSQARIENFRLGDFTLHNLSVGCEFGNFGGFAGFDGILGHDALAYFDITFDEPQRMLYLLHTR